MWKKKIYHWVESVGTFPAGIVVALSILLDSSQPPEFDTKVGPVLEFEAAVVVEVKEAAVVVEVKEAAVDVEVEEAALVLVELVAAAVVVEVVIVVVEIVVSVAPSSPIQKKVLHMITCLPYISNKWGGGLI